MTYANDSSPTNRPHAPRGPALVLAALAGCLAVVPSCAKKTVISEPPASGYQPPKPYDPSARPVSEQIGLASASTGEGPTLLAKQRLSASKQLAEGVARTPLEPASAELIRVQYTTRGADVGDVIRVLLGEHLQRDFVIDPKVTGQITIEIDDEFTRDELMEIVSGLGTLYGWFFEEREGVVFVRPLDRIPRTAQAPVLDGAPALESDMPAVRLRRLRYVAPDQVATMLKELMPESGRALVVGRTIVLADTTRSIARVSRLLAALDTPAFDGVEVWTYRLAHRRPDDAQKVLEQLATNTAVNSSTDPLLGFVAVPGTSRLMVIAKDASLQPMVGELLREIDRPADGERRQRYRYNIQHYPPQALVKLLTDFFAEKIEPAAGAGGAPAAAGDPGSRIRLVSDPQSDVLLILATPSDYSELLATLRAVDRAPQQVSIQSIIAEVRLTNALEFGVEYFLSTRSSLGGLELSGTTPLVNPALATGGAFFVGGDGFAIIQALDRESSARILSQPKIVVADRAKGSIQVGGEVPTIRATQGASSQQAGSSDIRQEIDYRDTGVILDIEPLVNESGTVVLKIRQEVTDSLPTEIANQPEFTTRNIETTVVVPSGQTVLLGGIINQDDRNDANRIPILGRIPVVGEAFGNKQNTQNRTELLLAITPTILNDPSDGVLVMNEFLQSLSGVRAAMLDMAAELPQGSVSNLAIPPAVETPAPESPAPAEPDS